MKPYPLALQNQHSHQHHLNQTQPNPKRILEQQKSREQEQLQHQYPVSLKETDVVALVVSRAPWWIPIVQSVSPLTEGSRKNIRNFTFAEALKDFLQNCSFHCYGKLVETGRRIQEKLLWLAFHVVALTLLIIILWNYNGTGEQLLTTSIYDPLYPISNVLFPAITICSINRISNDSAKRYAEELNLKDPKHPGVQYYYEQIKQLHFNYYVRGDVPDYDNALKFQRFLDIYDREESELFFNTRRRMAVLAPRCSNLLQRCRLGGVEFDCAQEFTETYTSIGVCCTLGPNQKNAAKRKFRNRFVGPDMGLVILLNASHKDDYFRSTNRESFEITIHSTGIHPEASSGSMNERVVENGTNTFMAVTPRIFETVAEVRFLKPKVRNCLYPDELPDIFGNSYTFSNCISYCRARSILALCECVPFTTPFVNLSLDSSLSPFCSLQHRQCLTRYYFKWFNVITQREHIRGLEREMEDALYCPHCLPTCVEVKHRVTVMDLPLNVYNMKSFPDYRQNLSDLAVVQIYFGVTHAVIYRRFLLNAWFEVFSYAGNICGIIAGFSLIGICEVIFFILQQVYTTLRNDEPSNVEKRGNVKAENSLIILP